MPCRVSNVALPMRGTITHLCTSQNTEFPFSDTLPSNQKKKESAQRSAQTWAPSRADGQRRCGARPRRRRGPRLKSTPRAMRGRAVRADERAAGHVDEDSTLLLAAQKLGVDDVACSVSAGCEFVRIGQADGAQAVARSEGGFESRVAGRGQVRGVDAVGEAEGGERDSEIQQTVTHTHAIYGDVTNEFHT